MHIILVRKIHNDSIYSLPNFLKMMLSCKTVVKYHNQDIDIDTVKTQNISLTKGFLILPF